jgi:hypothetical protein
VYPRQISLRTCVSRASSFSVGGYVCLHMLASVILLRFRLRRPLGHRRGGWFLLAAEQALKKSHLDTPISPERCFSATLAVYHTAVSHSNFVTPKQAPLPTNGVLVPTRFYFRTGSAAIPS